MKAHVTPTTASAEDLRRFQEESRRHDLRWTCRDCAHVVPSTQRCSMEYPNALLRDPEGYLDPRGHYRFCKYFELS